MNIQVPKTTDRVFVILETIAKDGPITLSELTETVELPRSSVHRAAMTLQRLGWVRARFNDHAYELSSKLDHMMADAHFVYEEVDALTSIMAEVKASRLAHADVGVFVRLGSFQIVDSTDPRVELNKAESMVTSRIAKVAQLSLDKTSLVRNLDAYLKDAGEDEARLVENGRHFAHLQLLREELGKPIGRNTTFIAPFRNPNGSSGAMRLRRISNSGTAIQRFGDLCSKVGQDLPDHIA